MRYWAQPGAAPSPAISAVLGDFSPRAAVMRLELCEASRQPLWLRSRVLPVCEIIRSVEKVLGQVTLDARTKCYDFLAHHHRPTRPRVGCNVEHLVEDLRALRGVE